MRAESRLQQGPATPGDICDGRDGRSRRRDAPHNQAGGCGGGGHQFG